MKKAFFAFVIIGILFCCLPFAFAIGTYGADLNSPAYNANNPAVNYRTECTWYSWGRANEKLGACLPWIGGHSNAKYWADNARNAGWLVDTTPSDNSVAVWTSGTYGHVAFVEELKANVLYLSEYNHGVDPCDHQYSEGYIRLSDGYYVNTFNRCTNDYYRGVPEYYIHLESNTKPVVTFADWESSSGLTYIRETDASVGMKITVSNGTCTETGMYLYNSSGTKVAQGRNNYYLSSEPQCYFAINAECGYTLSPGTTYKYKFYAIVNGETYWSPERSFTTTSNQKELDVNGWLNNSMCGDVSGYATFDMYINGTRVANDVKDFCQKVAYGSTYEIKDIKVASGKAFDGYSSVTRENFVSSGRTGTVTSNIDVRFSMHTVDAAAFVKNHQPAKTAVYNGHSYYFYNTPVTWYEAEIVSKHLGGHLVSITSADENSFVKSMIGNSASWLGATDRDTEGTWKWTSGETFKYSNWQSGQPDNAEREEGAENYLQIWENRNDWNDNEGCSCIPFVCEIDRAYTITYNSNNGSSAPVKQDKAVGQTIKLSNAKPTRNGYEFIGWAVSSEAASAQYQPGDTYSADASVTLYAVWGIAINEENFPDPVFREYVKGFDKNGDGKLSVSECASVKVIVLQDEEICSLKGIEYFYNLTDLVCTNNNLTELDVSNNTALTFLLCDSNALTELDVSKNTALTSLDCSGNGLSKLDVSNNTALTFLRCKSNVLNALDVSNNTALTYLECSDNELSVLDVSNNTMLASLECYSNSLRELDVNSNTLLTSIHCANNALNKLDVSKNTALASLVCSNNELIELDVSNNKALKSLSCSNISLTELDVSRNTALTSLECYSNDLTELDVSKNTALTDLRCFYNDLRELDVSNNTALTWLFCHSNDLTELDVSNNTALTDLYCYSNDLTELDVSNNTALTTLYCYSNDLTELDVSNNTALTSLYCYDNKLAKLDLSANKEITYLKCYGQDSALPMTYENGKTYYSLGEGFEGVDFGDGHYDAQTGILCFDGIVTYFEYDYPTGYTGDGGAMTVYAKPLELPEISIVAIDETNFPDEAFRREVSETYDRDEDGVLSFREWYYIDTFYLDGKGIRSLKGIELFPELGYLDCSGNELTELDLSGNPRLYDLQCGGNALLKLDLSGNPELEEIDCGRQFVFMDALFENGKTYYSIGEGFDADIFGAGHYDAQTGMLSFDGFVDSFGYAYSLGCGDAELTVTVYGEIAVEGETPVDEAHFPDRVFRSYVRDTIDTDRSGGLSAEEIAAVYEIDVSHSYDDWGDVVGDWGTVYSLQGIELFENLSVLSCDSNEITELDVRKNTKLTSLSCYDNNLSELDVSNNALLTSLCCISNYLTELDVSKNTALTSLSCGDNELSELDLSNNVLLTSLHCENTDLFELDVSNNTLLADLDCVNTGLRELDVSNNTALTNLDCYRNALTELDVSNNTALTSLICSVNGLRELDVSNNAALTSLDCSGNSLTELNVSNNTLLTSLYCHYNSLTKLDVSNNTLLVTLYCDHNSLAELDVSNNTALEWFSCEQNALTKLDLSANSLLDVYDVDLSGQIAFMLATTENGMTCYSFGEGYDGVDFGNGSYDAQTGILCFDGTVPVFSYEYPTGHPSGASLEVKVYGEIASEDKIAIDEAHFPDRVFRMYVHDILDTDGDGALNEKEITNVKEINISDESIHSLSGIELFENLEVLYCPGNALTSLDVHCNTKLTVLMCARNELIALDVSSNTELSELDCYGNSLSVLDVPSNLKLTKLSCGGNQLSALDVSNNTELRELECNSNELTVLDVSSNTELTYLACEFNQLIALDVSYNSELAQLYCDYNALTGLDLRNNLKLKELYCEHNQLTALDVRSNSELECLGCSDNALTSLDLSQNQKLEDLSCSPQSAVKPIRDDGASVYLAVDKELQMSRLSDAEYDPQTGEIILKRLAPKISYACATGFGNKTMNVEIIPDYRGIQEGSILPANLKIIEEEAFAGVPFRVLRIPDGMTTIGSKAFVGCSRLMLVFIPDSVTDIADDAFADCPTVAFACSTTCKARKYATRKGIPCIQ